MSATRLGQSEPCTVIKYMNNEYSSYKLSHHYPTSYRKRQGGIALVIGLLLLLVITILSVVAMRGTSLQERMSANNQQQTITFQGAESAIRNVMDELRSVTPPPSGATQSILITALQNGTSPTSTQLAATTRTADTTSSNSNNGTTNTATLTYKNTTTLTGASLGVGSGFVSFNFVVDATSTQANTNSSSHHQQEIGRAGPSVQQ